jgi:hypothetical protein
MGKIIGTLLIGLMLTVSASIVSAGPYEDGLPNANLVRRADLASIELTGLNRGPMLHGRVLAKPAKRPSGSMAGS